MLSKLTNKRSICQGRRSRRSGKGGEQEGGERPPPPPLLSPRALTYWFEKYTNSLPEEPFILAICYVKQVCRVNRTWVTEAR